MPELQTNVLYYGDNLDILRRYTIIAPTRSATDSQQVPRAGA